MFTDEEIFKSHLEDILEKERNAKRWKQNINDYPHTGYDYSTDDFDDFEYQQDLYLD